MRNFPNRPYVALGVVLHRDHDVLLVKRSKAPNKGQWSLIGGAQELGETLIEGAKRETREETGLEISDLAIIDAVDSIHHNAEGQIEYHYSIIEFSALYQSGNAQAMDDAAVICWVPLEGLGPYALSPSVLKVIRLSCSHRGLTFPEGLVD